MFFVVFPKYLTGEAGGPQTFVIQRRHKLKKVDFSFSFTQSSALIQENMLFFSTNFADSRHMWFLGTNVHHFIFRASLLTAKKQ